MKEKLITVYKELIIPIILIFCLFLLLLTALVYVYSQILNPERPAITSVAVNSMISLSAFLTLTFSSILVIVWVTMQLLERSPRLGRKLAKRTSPATAHNLKSILGLTSMPIFMLVLTFLILIYSAENQMSMLYFVAMSAFTTVLALILSIREGILSKTEEASNLLRRFSEDVKIKIDKSGSTFPSARKFVKALKTFDKTLPRACHIPSVGRRLSQVELILSFGNKKDLSTLSDRVLAFAESVESENLEGFSENYRNITEFLDTFENEKRGVVELAERISLKEKMKKQSGEVVKQILIKTVPFLIAILISIVIYLSLGFRPELSI